MDALGIRLPSLGGVRVHREINLYVGTVGAKLLREAIGALFRAIRGAPLKALPAALSGLDLSWLEILYSHVHNGNRESAGDLLFERIDDLLCDELFQDADNTIRTIDVGRLDSYALVGLLSVTYAARRELPSRAPMVRRIEARLAVVAPGRVEELMAGLR